LTLWSLREIPAISLSHLQYLLRAINFQLQKIPKLTAGVFGTQALNKAVPLFAVPQLLSNPQHQQNGVGCFVGLRFRLALGIGLGHKEFTSLKITLSRGGYSREGAQRSAKEPTVDVIQVTACCEGNPAQ
jgi:hypothetical protein